MYCYIVLIMHVFGQNTCQIACMKFYNVENSYTTEERDSGLGFAGLLTPSLASFLPVVEKWDFFFFRTIYIFMVGHGLFIVTSSRSGHGMIYLFLSHFHLRPIFAYMIRHVPDAE